MTGEGGEIASSRALAEDTIGGDVRRAGNRQGLIELEHAMVTVVADVQISRAVHGDRQGIAHPDVGRIATVDHAGVAGEAGAGCALSEDNVSGYVGRAGNRERLIEFEHAMIPRVGYVKIVVRVGSNTLREAQSGRRLCACRVGEEATLPEHYIRGETDTDRLRERLIIFEHAIVGCVGNVEISQAVNRDAAGQA